MPHGACGLGGAIPPSRQLNPCPGGKTPRLSRDLEADRSVPLADPAPGRAGSREAPDQHLANTGLVSKYPLALGQGLVLPQGVAPQQLIRNPGRESDRSVSPILQVGIPKPEDVKSQQIRSRAGTRTQATGPRVR